VIRNKPGNVPEILMFRDFVTRQALLYFAYESTVISTLAEPGLWYCYESGSAVAKVLLDH
jgi:hypothetical protein